MVSSRRSRSSASVIGASEDDELTADVRARWARVVLDACDFFEDVALEARDFLDVCASLFRGNFAVLCLGLPPALAVSAYFVLQVSRAAHL